MQILTLAARLQTGGPPRSSAIDIDVDSDIVPVEPDPASLPSPGALRRDVHAEASAYVCPPAAVLHGQVASPPSPTAPGACPGGQLLLLALRPAFARRTSGSRVAYLPYQSRSLSPTISAIRMHISMLSRHRRGPLTAHSIFQVVRRSRAVSPAASSPSRLETRAYIHVRPPPRPGVCTARGISTSRRLEGTSAAQTSVPRP